MSKVPHPVARINSLLSCDPSTGEVRDERDTGSMELEPPEERTQWIGDSIHHGTVRCSIYMQSPELDSFGFETCRGLFDRTDSAGDHTIVRSIDGGNIHVRQMKRRYVSLPHLATKHGPRRKSLK